MVLRALALAVAVQVAVLYRTLLVVRLLAMVALVAPRRSLVAPRTSTQGVVQVTLAV
jgi:hypothetical protein